MGNKDCKYYPSKPSQCTEGNCEIRKSLNPGTKYCPIYFCKLAAAKPTAKRPPVTPPPAEPIPPTPTPTPAPNGRKGTISGHKVTIDRYKDFEKEINAVIDSQSSSLVIADALYESFLFLFYFFKHDFFIFVYARHY